MKKHNDFSYGVHQGEQITIKVAPKNFGGSLFSVLASLDDKMLPPLPGTDNSPVYQFIVTKPVDETHCVVMEFHFDSPDNAFYDVAITGQNDEGCPCGFAVSKHDEFKIKTILFDTHGGGGGTKG